MEEDIARRRQEAVGTTKYTICTACGCPIPRSRAVLVPGEVLGESRSEHGELCPDCAGAVDRGDHIPLE